MNSQNLVSPGFSCRNWACAAFLISLTACGPEPESPATATEPESASVETTGPSARAIALNNQGVALMGQFDYAAAADAFADLLVLEPDWSLAHLNQAIAILNRQQPGDDQRALALLGDLLEAETAALDAHYLSGILRFNQGDAAQALAHFQHVADADTQDAYAAYFTGQSLLQQGRDDEALPYFEHAIVTDPYLRSAYYGAFLVQQRKGDREEARRLLEVYQRLDANPRSTLAEIKYTRMGPKAMARSVRGDEGPSTGDIQGPLFGDRASLNAAPVGDVQAASVWRNEQGLVRLVVHGESSSIGVELSSGSALDGEQFPFLATDGVVASAWGDLDNNGLLDVYLARRGANQMWMAHEDGWREQAQALGIAEGGEARDVLMVDADHDGDLDLFMANQSGSPVLLNNNGDGSFRNLDETSGLDMDSGAVRQLLAGDFDADRDLDLLVLRVDGGVDLFRNDRMWRYRHEHLNAYQGGLVAAVALADLDVDGWADLVGISETGQPLGYDRQAREWQARGNPVDGLGSVTGLRLVDLDGDGQAEWLVQGKDAWTPDGQTRFDGRFLALANLDPSRGPAAIDVVDGQLGHHAPGAGRGAFMALSFQGAEDPGQSMRSNYAAIGTRFVVRSGDHWVAGSSLRNGSGPGQDAQPIAVGLGAKATIDYVEIDWPDGVFQTELNLSAGELHTLVETQRQLASCPVLFGWDGDRHQFLSDVLGVGGIGFAIGPDEYAQPRPWEVFPLPGELVARNGAYEILLTEPMEEIAYLDRARLIAIDYPEELSLGLDERMATAEPMPSGDPVFYRTSVTPIAARDARGLDRLESLQAADLRAAPPGRLDSRFPGLLQEEAVLELEFDRDLSQLQRPVLLMDGWVEYGYSQTSFAAWQAGIRHQSASLDAWVDGQGWVTVAPSFGYPAGMPRVSSLPLDPLPPGTRRLRLRTNQEIYWDRVVVVERLSPSIHRHELPLQGAEVRFVGFPERSDGPQKQPHYDFSKRAEFWDTRYPTGAYTAYGDATELVNRADNALAIIGPGDAVVMRFADRLPPVADGWRRQLLIALDGWAKDMDLYTRDGGTVGPLPSAERETDRSRELHPVYNTRFLSGR